MSPDRLDRKEADLALLAPRRNVGERRAVGEQWPRVCGHGIQEVDRASDRSRRGRYRPASSKVKITLCCKSLKTLGKNVWLGDRDSNPKNLLQSRPKRKR